ncbi:MAG: dehypoxanthine futalosine cyclase [Planctomycetaceae bacterium]|jgi:cyclic dehypoxanthinyl futalosine synthase|nr:dehypoxanthine futalosine cyclase [Planctomycetaceae bacterium]
MNRCRQLLSRTLSGERLSENNALFLYENADLQQLGEAADALTQKRHPEPFRTYNIERNVNYTNICVSGCQFCAFFRKPEDDTSSGRLNASPSRYVMSIETLLDKIQETVALGGNQILLQGGLHPSLPLEWYEDILRTAKRYFPQVNMHGFSPTEIVHFAKLSRCSTREVLERLRAAGLGSLPGGGAEILVDRVRRQVSPNKATADEWLDACRTWHKMGGRGSATMMFGHTETHAERIEHLSRLRTLQEETGGFTAFICWTFQPGNTRLSHLPKLSADEYLRMLAVSRLFLDNFANLQASWVTQGMTIGTKSLHYGASDMGSIMIEENVVAAAGTVFRTNEQELRAAIESAGFVPHRRNVFYELARE